jgi:uncharacterized membrane protein (UPF0127 family)
MGQRDLSRVALFFPRCTSIHTCFMRGPIDVVFVDRDKRVVAVQQAVSPWRFLFGPRGSHSVLELPAGGARQQQLEIGDILRWQSA